jgi:uncharacterized protein (TIGR02118 family)
MARLIALYKPPSDEAAFDRYYFGTHVPLAKTIPGLRRYEVNRGPIGAPEGPAPAYLVAILHFDDMASLEAGLRSPEGRKAAADLANFAAAGVDVLILETREV